MKKKQNGDIRMKASWLAGALGIVLVYFGMFGVLMYPVVQASGPVV